MIDQSQQQRRTKRGARAVRESGLKHERRGYGASNAAGAGYTGNGLDLDDDDDDEEEYTTRSGRQTKKRVVAGSDGYDDDASFNGEEDEGDLADLEIANEPSGRKRKRKKRKRSPNSANTAQLRYSIAFADQVGTYPYAFEVEVPAVDLASIRVDALGRITDVGGRADLKIGDRAHIPDDAVGTMTAQEFLDSSMLTGRGVVFSGHRERYMSKLTGLKGVLIHPTKLYDAVKATGGYDHIVANHLWQKVRRRLNLPNTIKFDAARFEDYVR
ncbi:Hypothetical Protein FCC1311_055682 [Hondaea fermentalgiana]|uniref:ARID domain-containing protein n=1 Tax=Hondaea fermentalgiana TaxID=2315210 RepID=A0A2R5GEJ6_9STRA|nr:Hypothetical Protein FCC1311_055682 [Hondaea fermentalgiana]|eukprot:GBG29346.1 Hypothetical Protein FCC1311_055682 [Hondaea fermentalgiana]